MNDKILMHAGHDPNYLLENKYYDELSSRIDETLNQIFSMYLASRWKDLGEILRYEASFLEFMAASLKEQDDSKYALFRLGSLLGTVESFSRLRYEQSQDEWAFTQFQAELRTIKHLPDIILALEVHGPMTHRELSESLHMNPPTLTEAMKKVLETDVIDVRTSGKHKIYSLTDTGLRLGRELRRQKQTGQVPGRAAPPAGDSIPQWLMESAQNQLRVPSYISEAALKDEIRRSDRQTMAPADILKMRLCSLRGISVNPMESEENSKKKREQVLYLDVENLFYDLIDSYNPQNPLPKDDAAGKPVYIGKLRIPVKQK